jgi:hypothetical protein
MFLVTVSLVISMIFGCYKPQIIPLSLLVTTENAVELLVSEELGHLWTDEKRPP